jgi:methyltransferase-like protein
MAILRGLTPAPVDNCRVLEIACGDGANLIPMAYAIPGSEFVGFDLARSPIERGQRRIRELGLRNVRIFEMDLLDAGTELGEFDYIIAHGVYAWIPGHARDRLLELCDQLLAANGVAFVSYAAMPGGHLRLMIRDMMLLGAEGVTKPENRTADGLKFLEFLIEARPEGDVFRALLDQQLKKMKTRNPAAIFHDELSDAYRPVHFIEFVEHARQHGLQYLCEAELPPAPDPCYRKEVLRQLESAVGADNLKQEQVLDFVRMRMYRETLLVKAGAEPRRDFRGQDFRRLLLASEASEGPAEAGNAAAFLLPGGGRMESNHPGVVALLRELGAAWPRALSWEELGAKSVAAQGLFDGEGAALLLRLASARMIELRAWRAPVAPALSEHPRASACSRHEARTREHATSLLHKTVSLKDAKVRSLLRLLDGTRDRRDLVEAMKAEFPGSPAGELENGLDSSLRFSLIAGILEG